MSKPAYTTFLLFVWISLIYVIIAFTDVTAGTFARFQQFPMTVDGVTYREGDYLSINGTAESGPVRIGNFTQTVGLTWSWYSTSASASAVRSTGLHITGLEPR